MDKQRLTIAAPAKINLHLAVTGRREDGYHLLETVMVKLDLADRLTVEAGGAGLHLDVGSADLPAGEDNLVWRAASSFFRAAGLPPAAVIRLEKYIPTAAGLGGGSSDAAAALKALNRLHRFPLGDEELFRLGLALGADVPFFLLPCAAAAAEGIGEVLRPLPDPESFWVVLINPGWPLSTAWVYNHYRIELTSARRDSIFSGLNESSFTMGRVLSNDLESVVFAEYPEVAQLKDRLLAAGATGALMTGSGPTVFGVFSDGEAARNGCRRLRAESPAHWLIETARSIEDGSGSPA